MNGFLRALLGVDESEIPADAVTRFEFANAPRGAMALLFFLVLAALVAGVFWVYRREGSASKRVKLSLAALRAGALAVGVVLFLEPVLAIDRVEQVDKSTILLLDESLSMSTVDRYHDPVAREALYAAAGSDPRANSRAALVNAVLRATGLPEALARNNAVRVFTFSDRLSPRGSLPRGAVGEAAALPPLDPYADPRAARGTDLAGAISDAVEQVGGDRVAAIVVATDGRATLGPPVQDVALYLKNKALPLFAVAVGEAEAARNLRAVALAGPDRIFRKDPAAFEARVEGRGYDGATVLFERRHEGGEWERVATRPVAFPAEPKPVELTFFDRPERVGPVEYRILLEAAPEESTLRDNEKVLTTRVVDEKVKVLLISGAPSHEYHAVKNVLLRDATTQVACFLQSADPQFPQDGNDISLREIPADEKSLFEFDVVFLLDPDGERMPKGFWEMLQRFVADHRGGLGVVAGNKYTLRLLRGGEESALGKMLPVVVDLRRADDPVGGIGYGGYFERPWRMEPEPAAFSHPVTRFHSDPKRALEMIWKRLPPLYWFFPVLKEKPGAVVLARHEDPRERVEPYGRRPIAAVHRYGGGNVFFLAADETHRWRSVAEPVFERLWVQAVRFLMEGRLQGSRRRFHVHLDREIVDLGDAVQIQAEAYDENFKPYRAASVPIVVEGPDGLREEVALLAVANEEGRYSGSFAPPEAGDYAVDPADAAFVSTEPPDGAKAAASFLVILPDREMGDVRADRPLLAELAARTRGRAVDLADARALADERLIPPASERVVTQGRPVALWDTWTTIVLMLSLLCAEWILRKLHRMV